MFIKPGDPTALYNVSFSYIGEGRGLIKQSLGNYSFVGINQEIMLRLFSSYAELETGR